MALAWAEYSGLIAELEDEAQLRAVRSTLADPIDQLSAYLDTQHRVGHAVWALGP